MRNFNKVINYVIVSIISLMTVSVMLPVYASAQEATANSNTNNLIPLEIVPKCSSNATNIAYWEVTNKNIDPVNVGWSVGATGTTFTGSHVAPAANTSSASKSTMQTHYDGTDPNNTTTFTYNNLPLGSTNARDYKDGGCEAYQVPVSAPCLDGHTQQNLIVSYTSNNIASIMTKDNGLLCEDTTVFLSSYVMPDNYDGIGFAGNTTAYPQTIFDSKSVTLSKGTAANVSLTVTLPNVCKNTQIDVYYGPEITIVGANGHGTQNILSQVYRSVGSCVPVGSGTPTTTPPSGPTPPVFGGFGGGGIAVSPPAPTENNTATKVPSAQANVLPRTLPNTGSSVNSTKAWLIIIVGGLITTVAAYFSAEKFQKRLYS